MVQFQVNHSTRMPVYFFHILRGTARIEDEEGEELPDMAAARQEVVASVRDLVADDMRSGQPIDLSDRIEIANLSGRVMATMTFREAILRRTH